MRIRVLALLPFVLACACNRPAEPAKRPAAVPPAPAMDAITLERRDDGLYYQVGAAQPFTGTDVEPDRKKEQEEQRMGFVLATPYQAGRIHGAKTCYYPGGGVQEERVFENGVARSSTLYFPPSRGGGKKLEVPLNAKDVAEGRMLRYFPNGKLFTEAFLDADEKWHGDFKEYSEDGTLQGHYRWEHGVLREMVSETPEQKAKREKDKPSLKVEPAS